MVKGNPINRLTVVDYLRFYLPFLTSPQLRLKGSNEDLSPVISQESPPAFSMPSVCVIIPTRDRANLLRKCVDSLNLEQLGSVVELIIIDNDSRDPDARAYLAELERMPRVRVVVFSGEFNYSAICNYASGLTSAKFLCFANNDLLFNDRDWLQNMIGHFLRDSKVGLVGSVLKYPDGTIQHAGIVIGQGKLASHLLAGHSTKALSDLPQCFEVSGVTFALAVTTRNIFHELGGLDQRFKVGLNDVDFSIRAREKGYRIVTCGENEVFHEESATRGHMYKFAASTRAVKEVTMFIKKHYPITRDEFFAKRTRFRRV